MRTQQEAKDYEDCAQQLSECADYANSRDYRSNAAIYLAQISAMFTYLDERIERLEALEADCRAHFESSQAHNYPRR